MAGPRGPRRNQPLPEEVFELGKQGRKTGVTIRDTGDRDEYDMQPLDALNSSPEKTDTVRFGARTPSVNGAQFSEDEEDESDYPMDIENTTAPDPQRLLNGMKMPLPRARSPAKTFLQSPAHKNPHLGPSSSPVRGSIVEQQRARDEAEVLGLSPKRRLDFGMNGASRLVLKPTRTSPRTTRKPARDEEDEDEEAILQGQEDTTNGADESMALLDAGDDMPLIGDDDDVELGEESRNDDVPQTNGHAARKNTRKSARLSESLLDETADVPEPESEPEEEEEPAAEQVVTPKPSPKQSKKRGRPAAAKPTPAPQHDEEEDEAPRRATKRRRSNNAAEEEPAEPAEPAPKKAAGRPRGRPAGAGKQILSPSESSNAPAARKPKGRPGRPPKTAARRSESPAAGADASLAVIPRGPPLPKSRGLMINRRIEVPGSNDGILRTRSGRNSFKPLAFWRNEHVDYDPDAVADDITVRGGKGNRVLLPTVKEIVRIEEEAAPSKKKYSHHHKFKTTSSSRSGKSSSNPNAFYDPEPADSWETEAGQIFGDVIAWKPEYDLYPPSLEEEVELEEDQLAVAGRAIQTKEIRNATFRFAKTLNQSFFGAGVVDLPPGAEKRPKNSRKMYMAFFVFAGRVKVTIGQDNEFRISRGGMWFVPRGNLYSITNDYDEPARVFFSQGCEPVQRLDDLEEDAGPAE